MRSSGQHVRSTAFLNRLESWSAKTTTSIFSPWHKLWIVDFFAKLRYIAYLFLCLFGTVAAFPFKCTFSEVSSMYYLVPFSSLFGLTSKETHLLRVRFTSMYIFMSTVIFVCLQMSPHIIKS